MKAADVLLWLLAIFCGYLTAHLEVARECERLGGFYVGSTVYRCEVRK